MEQMTTQELIDSYRAVDVAARAYRHPAMANAAEASLQKFKRALETRAAAEDVLAKNFLKELARA